MSQINVGYDNYSKQHIDRSYGALSVGANVPYASVAAANLAVNVAYRYRGKTVLVDDGSGAREYWWRVDTQDASLVPKVLTPQMADFVVGDGQSLTPVAGTVVYTNPALVNCRILGFEVEGSSIAGRVRTGTPYFTYGSVGGTITVTNTIFSQDSWYKVLFIQL